MPLRSQKFAMLSHDLIANRARSRGGIDLGKIVISTCLDCDINMSQMPCPDHAPPKDRAEMVRNYSALLFCGGMEVRAVVLWMERATFKNALRRLMPDVPFVVVTERNISNTERFLRELFE